MPLSNVKVGNTSQVSTLAGVKKILSPKLKLFAQVMSKKRTHAPPRPSKLLPSKVGLFRYRPSLAASCPSTLLLIFSSISPHL